MEIQAPSERIRAENPAIRLFEKITHSLSFWLYQLAGVGLVGMMLLTIADIIGIKIFASPVPGAIEVVAFLGVVAIGAAIAYTQVLHGHIRVDFIIMKFPPRAMVIIDILMLIFAMIFFAVLAWQSLIYGQALHSSGEVSMTQRIPFYPFVYGLVFCYGITFLVLAIQCVREIMKAGKIWTQ